MHMLILVLLTNRAAADEVTDQAASAAVVGLPQPMQCLLGTLMTGVVSLLQKLRPQCGGIRHKNAPLVRQQPINKSPVSRHCAGCQLVT